jgi:hypothetical protein
MNVLHSATRDLVCHRHRSLVTVGAICRRRRPVERGDGRYRVVYGPGARHRLLHRRLVLDRLHWDRTGTRVADNGLLVVGRLRLLWLPGLSRCRLLVVGSLRLLRRLGVGCLLLRLRLRIRCLLLCLGVGLLLLLVGSGVRVLRVGRRGRTGNGFEGRRGTVRVWGAEFALVGLYRRRGGASQWAESGMERGLPWCPAAFSILKSSLSLLRMLRDREESVGTSFVNHKTRYYADEWVAMSGLSRIYGMYIRNAAQLHTDGVANSCTITHTNTQTHLATKIKKNSKRHRDALKTSSSQAL